MNARNAKLYLPLVQALADGKQLQYRNRHGEWNGATEVDFGLEPNDYRIKPEPRTVWIVYRQDGRRFEVCDSEHEAELSRCVVNGTISKFKEVV